MHVVCDKAQYVTLSTVRSTERSRVDVRQQFPFSISFSLPSACPSCLLGPKNRVHPEPKWSCASTPNRYPWRGAPQSTAQFLPLNDCYIHKRCSQRICNASGCAVHHHSVKSCDLRGPGTAVSSTDCFKIVLRIILKTEDDTEV